MKRRARSRTHPHGNGTSSRAAQRRSELASSSPACGHRQGAPPGFRVVPVAAAHLPVLSRRNVVKITLRRTADSAGSPVLFPQDSLATLYNPLSPISQKLLRQRPRSIPLSKIHLLGQLSDSPKSYHPRSPRPVTAETKTGVRLLLQTLVLRPRRPSLTYPCPLADLLKLARQGVPVGQAFQRLCEPEKGSIRPLADRRRRRPLLDVAQDDPGRRALQHARSLVPGLGRP